MKNMKITLIINTFKKVLKDYEKEYKKNNFLIGNLSAFICYHAAGKYNIYLQSIFCKAGYYRNYVNTNALKLPDSAFLKGYWGILKWKINFLKQEIKELTLLKEQGYTHI